MGKLWPDVALQNDLFVILRAHIPWELLEPCRHHWLCQTWGVFLNGVNLWPGCDVRIFNIWCWTLGRKHSCRISQLLLFNYSRLASKRMFKTMCILRNAAQYGLGTIGMKLNGETPSKTTKSKPFLSSCRKCTISWAQCYNQKGFVMWKWLIWLIFF